MGGTRDGQALKEIGQRLLTAHMGTLGSVPIHTVVFG